MNQDHHLKRDYTREQVNQANIEYHDGLAARYNERHELFHQRLSDMYQALLSKHIFAKLSSQEKISILDVACGTGCLEEFFQKDNHSVVAFDISPKMIDVARNLYPKVSFKVGDAYHMPVEKNQLFDLVAENGALHHMKDYFDVIHAMASRVRPGGFIYLGCEPNVLGFKAFSWCRGLYRKLVREKRVEEATGARDSELEMVSEYHQFFTKGLCPHEISKFLEARGFENVQVLYRMEHFFAQLYDRLGLTLIDWLPEWCMRLVGPLALNFHLVANKRLDDKK